VSDPFPQIDPTSSTQPVHRPKLWRWVLGTFIVLISWLIVGSLLTIWVAEIFDLDLAVLTGTDDESLALLRNYAPWQAASAVLISFIPLLVAPILLHRFLLKGTGERTIHPLWSKLCPRSTHWRDSHAGSYFLLHPSGLHLQ